MANTALSQERLRIIAALHLLSDKYGTLEDTARILSVMAAVAPDRPEIAVAQARNLLYSKNYAEARLLLNRAEEKHPRNPVVKAMLALCMYIQQDSLWETYAEDTLGMPDNNAISRGIIEALAKSSGQTLRGMPTEADAAPQQPYQPAMGLVC